MKPAERGSNAERKHIERVEDVKTFSSLLPEIPGISRFRCRFGQPEGSVNSGDGIPFRAEGFPPHRFRYLPSLKNDLPPGN
jgi:hypothetical protein